MNCRQFGFLAITAFVLLEGCNGSDGAAMPPSCCHSCDCVAQGPQNNAGFVLDRLLAPTTSTEYAIDLDGDGAVDNKFAGVVRLLGGFGIDMQVGWDNVVHAGTGIELLQLKSNDPSFHDDKHALVVLNRARQTASPDFGGHGTFVIDDRAEPADFSATLSGGQSVQSDDPVRTKNAVTLRLPLALDVAVAPTVLRLNGAHIAFIINRDSTLRGTLQGSITAPEVARDIAPALAATFNRRLADAPGSSFAMGILAAFDIGGCVDPNGTKAMASDGQINSCEVLTSAVGRDTLSPDLAIFDPISYAPAANRARKDSLSVGIGFTAVPAIF